MSSYWSGTAVTGMLLNEQEFQAMVNLYKEQNPSHAEPLTDILDDGQANDALFIRSRYAGDETVPIYLEDGNITEDTYPIRDRIFTVSQLSEDWVDGLDLVPFYRKNGQMNRNIRNEKGQVAIWQYHACHSLKAQGSAYLITSDKSFWDTRVFQERPYASYNEFKQEFIDKIGSYLPDDFDWDGHLGYITYACYA